MEMSRQQNWKDVSDNSKARTEILTNEIRFAHMAALEAYAVSKEAYWTNLEHRHTTPTVKE
jgi:hypothetical protein